MFNVVFRVYREIECDPHDGWYGKRTTTCLEETDDTVVIPVPTFNEETLQKVHKQANAGRKGERALYRAHYEFNQYKDSRWDSKQ